MSPENTAQAIIRLLDLHDDIHEMTDFLRKDRQDYILHLIETQLSEMGYPEET